MKNELQKHKKSDSIKWVVVFILIALLAISMLGIIVQASSDYLNSEQLDKTTNTDNSLDDNENTSVNNLNVVNLNLKALAFCLSESGEETLTIEQNGLTNIEDVNVTLNSLDAIFENEIFDNEYFYGKIFLTYDDFNFVFEKDGVYRIHSVCVDSIYYESTYEHSYKDENGEDYMDTYSCVKINYFYDESASGVCDVRYNTILLVKLTDTNNPELAEAIGTYSWNIYSELPTYSRDYKFVGMYFTDDIQSLNCFAYNSVIGE